MSVRESIFGHVRWAVKIRNVTYKCTHIHISPQLNSSLLKWGCCFRPTSSDCASFLVRQATSNPHVWDTSKLIPSKSTRWWENCIRLICSGHTMPRFDTVLPVIKWWNHQGSAPAVRLLFTQRTWAADKLTPPPPQAFHWAFSQPPFSIKFIWVGVWGVLHYVYKVNWRDSPSRQD